MTRRSQREYTDMENEPKNSSLVENNPSPTSGDVIMDLKTGIYNLFVSLFHNYVPTYGLEGAIQMSTDFLEEIVVNFRQTLVEEE